MALAMNMFSQGIDPCLDFSDIDAAVKIYERTTRMPVHHGTLMQVLVYTAFSGSASRRHKERHGKDERTSGQMEVPYLPIDPKDVGRDVRSYCKDKQQSGKGGLRLCLNKTMAFSFQRHSTGFQLCRYGIFG